MINLITKIHIQTQGFEIHVFTEFGPNRVRSVNYTNVNLNPKS